MNNSPLVSVICLNFNQGEYLEEAINSVLNQHYSNLELILVDDASSDGSRDLIKRYYKKLKAENFPIRMILNKENTGNCRAFNMGLKYVHGKYIIDLAADDVLLPDRVGTGVRDLERLPANYGVHFCNAAIIDEKGELKKYHFPVNQKGKVTGFVSQGGIYSDILKKSYICAATMMVKKSVYDSIGGYDENLAYEDFDFWIRSSKLFKYFFSDQVLIQRRIVTGSLSNNQNRVYPENPLESPLYSTYLVCKKAYGLNAHEKEHRALAIRLKKEMRQCLFLKNYQVYGYYLALLRKTGHPGMEGRFYMFISYLFGLNALTPIISLFKRIRGATNF